MLQIASKINVVFYENLNKKIEENIVGKENKIIIGGDFNVTLDPAWDCSGGNQTKKASVKYIEDLCLDFDLTDIWCIRNPEVKRFTWRQKKLLIQKEDIEKSDIISSINSDHSAVTLHFSSVDKQNTALRFGNSTLVL